MGKVIKRPPLKYSDENGWYCPHCLYKDYKEYFDSKLKEFEKILEEEIEFNSKSKSKGLIIPEDILTKAKTTLESQKFTTAKSKTIPHQYCNRNDWNKEIAKLEEIAQIIRIYGKAEIFWGKPYRMLYIGDFKYWILSFPLEVITTINRTLIRDCTREELMGM